MARSTIWFGLVTLCGLAIFSSGCGGRAVVPTSYKNFKANDESFKIDYPAEWSVDSGGGRGVLSWAKFTSGNTTIKVDSDLVGSLMADISKLENPLLTNGPVPTEMAPVALIHERSKEEFEEETGVQEQAASLVGTNMMDARQSEFTGKSTFGGAIHGYRVTALTADRRVQVVCLCPESEWDTLKPIFNKIIATLAKGK